MENRSIPGYLSPNLAESPKERWRDHHVIYNSDPLGATEKSWSLAVGFWDKKPSLGIRWNGDPSTPLGNPKSHGVGTWLIIPRELHKAILISMSTESETKVFEALAFLEGRGWTGV